MERTKRAGWKDAELVTMGNREAAERILHRYAGGGTDNLPGVEDYAAGVLGYLRKLVGPKRFHAIMVEHGG
ncbi:MAG: hypothetical protein KGI98_16145 [Euryarchaeota archaeon]|nr:hypothetical protein [Euryarchaeota archaeon]MDE1879530.1 hypothetical protein [Euryarchaeota archaeon]